MKQLPVDFFSITEIGGVGEMIYKAVRFPECVPEYDHERKEDTIVPIYTMMHRPESGLDYRALRPVSSTQSVRDINHPLSGCAVNVIQRNHLSVYTVGVQATVKERKGD